MQDSTRQTLAAILAIDPTIGPQKAGLIIKRLTESPDDPGDAVRLIARPKEAALALGVTVRSIANFAARGTLEKIYLPGQIHALGYRWQDVRKLAGLA
jgi:hypothetical protein